MSVAPWPDLRAEAVLAAQVLRGHADDERKRGQGKAGAVAEMRRRMACMEGDAVGCRLTGGGSHEGWCSVFVQMGVRHGHAGMYRHMASADNIAGNEGMTKVAEALAANETLTSVDLSSECTSMA